MAAISVTNLMHSVRVQWKSMEERLLYFCGDGNN